MRLRIYLELSGVTERQKLYPLLELGRVVGNERHALCELYNNPQVNQLNADQKEEMANVSRGRLQLKPKGYLMHQNRNTHNANWPLKRDNSRSHLVERLNRIIAICWYK